MEVITISKVEPVQSKRKSNLEEKRSMPFKDTIRRQPTLKEIYIP